jgi:hypothetical protein
MKTFRKLTFITVLIAMIIALAVPAFAQETTGTRTFTLTEQRINESYRVTNSPRRSVDELSVDLQPGQAVINAAITFPRQETIQTQSVLTPTITDGRLYWTVASVTVDGEPASADLVTQINSAIASSWRVYVRQQIRPGRLTDVTITDTEIAYTYSTAR